METEEVKSEEVKAEPFADIDEITLSYGELNSDDYPMGVLAYQFSDYVSELSGGGPVDMFRGNTVLIIDYNCVKLNLFGTPYTFRDREHLWAVLESEIGISCLNEPTEVGSKIKALFYAEEGA